MPRVMLVDDHRVLAEGLEALLSRAGMRVVAIVHDGREVAALAAKHRPDVAVMDIGLPGLSGVEATAAVLDAAPATRIVVLTVHDDRAYVTEALRAGARGYVLKSQAGEELVAAIEHVMGGGVYLSPGVSGAVVDGLVAGAEGETAPLSPREREVVRLIAEGFATKQIAGALGVSVKTVETHRARLMNKLDIRDTAGLVRWAIRHGLIAP